MPIYILNPLDDPRWSAFLRHHPLASVFHTVGWVEALRRTYQYEPVVYTTSRPGRTLTNGILLCRVSSRLTGNRMVSVPFADHCEPLVESGQERDALLTALRCSTERTWKYVELRPRSADETPAMGGEPSAFFSLHTLDVRPPLEEILRRFHKSTIFRKIRRAEQAQLRCEEGRSQPLLREFYRLLLLTRRRHRVPPQPIEWFENLIDCLEGATILVARHRGEAVAAMLTILHEHTLVYKYGCSDARHHHFGAMPFLFSKAVANAKAAGASSFDLGRSDLENQGLIQFKERLGATATPLVYRRLSARRIRPGRSHWYKKVSAHVLAHLPDRLFVSAGRLLYPHIG